MRSPLLASLFLLLSPCAAQSAAVLPYGAGCAYLGQTLAIGVQGLPRIGTTFTFTYSGPNWNNQLSTQPVLALGLAADNSPIPQTVLPLQPPGCTAWIVPEAFAFMATTATGAWQTQIDMSVPNDATLIGMIFTAQWLAIVVQCGIVPPCMVEAVPTSDAALLIVGT